MSDIQASLGANITPFKQAMAEATVLAKQTGAKIGDSLGVEGLKSSERLKGSIQGFFKDLAGGADVSTAAMGRLSDSFRMGAGALVAVAAVQYLASALQKGYESAQKFGEALKESLSISGDNSKKSLEQMNDEIAQLKQQAKDTDLAAMSKLEAGATVFVQALEQGKNISDVIVEDAKEHFDIVQKEHAEEDAAATQSIAQQNEILGLKIAGNEEMADAMQDELNDQNRLLELQRKGDADAIAALQEQIDLKKKLRDITKDKAEQKDSSSLDGQIAAERAKQQEIGKTPEQKLADAQAKVASDQAKIAAAAAANTPHSEADLREKLLGDALGGTSAETRALEAKKEKLKLEQDITAEMQLQNDVTKQNADATRSASEQESDRVKSALEKQASIKQEVSEEDMTGQQKAAFLADKIAKDKKQAVADARLQTRSQQLDEQNRIAQDELALKKQNKENSDAAKAQAEKDKRAQQEAADRWARGRTAHDPITSLRKLGFGKAPGGGGVHHSMDSLVPKDLSSLADPSHHSMSSLVPLGPTLGLLGRSPRAGVDKGEKLGGKLDSIHAVLRQLNDKIGGAA